MGIGLINSVLSDFRFDGFSRNCGRPMCYHSTISKLNLKNDSEKENLLISIQIRDDQN